MASFVRRVLSRLLGEPKEEVRYIDFVEASSRLQVRATDGGRAADRDGGKKVRHEPSTPFGDRIGAAPDTPADFPPTSLKGAAPRSGLHPDDDWFPARTPRDPSALATGMVEREGSGAADLATLLEAAEEAEPDVESASAVAEVEGGELVVEHDEWLFADLPDDQAEARPDDTLADVFDLPSWDDGDVGREPPAPLPAEGDREENVAWRAGSRAAALIDELDLPQVDRRNQALRWLEELLREFPHPASHAAVARLIRSGLSLDELGDTALIVRAWRANSSLWLIRRFEHRLRRWTVRIDHRRGSGTLTWKKAAALAVRVDAVEAVELLAGEWRDEWLQLTPDQPGSGGYAAFACMKIARIGQLELGPPAGDPVGVDDRGWLRRLDPSLATAIAPDGRLAYHALPLSTRDPRESPKRSSDDAPSAVD